MNLYYIIHIVSYLLMVGWLYFHFRFFRHGFWLNLLLLAVMAVFIYGFIPEKVTGFLLYWGLPLQGINTVFFALLDTSKKHSNISKKYTLKLQVKNGSLRLENIRRGVSIIGSAGSGKTESVVYNFLRHFRGYQFCGVIHDYKHFEITEMAYPLFNSAKLPFYIISFDTIYHRVNPIAPKYMVDEESVNEVSRVLLENLLEQRENTPTGSTKFFNDAVEGLLGGLIWKLKTSHPKYCTLPHLIATFLYLDADNLVRFISSDYTSKSMANAFISGKDSERQTAAVLSTLANALKKISTQRIFMALSADEVPLDINHPNNPAVVSIVNNPKFEAAYSPVIATILHTITKQMSVRGQRHSFLMMEEAPTIRLFNMHRIPATLRSYDIATVYVLQDKIQNDLLYGEKASRAILSNLSYQFFGKANDPDTATYYERFFEIVKKPTTSVNKSHTLNFDTRITTGEREVAKIRANVFFRLQQGEFIAFADGKERKIQFKPPSIVRQLPAPKKVYSKAEIQANFERIHLEVRRLFQPKL
ncbi:MAG TPA: type IV secretory system conjugative DNA transfer family protein [Bacteroidetes bacterium]|nr:type IV secretory system conjugative DNA transfer family protein [Bacteroidota bacterium]